MKTFFVAWQFLTIFPGLKRNQEISPKMLGQSMAFYPTIGLILGLILWAADTAFLWVLPRPLTDGLIILLLAIFTGALHLDGLADTLDGLGSRKATEEKLRIMKDHRVGTFGVVGLIFVLGLKFLALDSLPKEMVGRTLTLALIVSRWSMVQLTYRAPYGRPEGGLGLVFKENIAKRDMILASATSLIFSTVLFRFWGAMLWLIAGMVTLGLQAFFTKRIGGITGDILGAANETVEIFVLILISGFLHFHL
jgi:adenosylcobinamide-GDP ribazoletransferase